MQYKAENKLDIFEFHDAELSLGCFDKNTLVFSATHLNIHKHTKQNPGDCDLEIERAVLRFEHMESVTFENRSPIENGNPAGEQIVLEGADAVKEMLSGFVKGIRVFALFEENRRIIMDCSSKFWSIPHSLYVRAVYCFIPRARCAMRKTARW